MGQWREVHIGDFLTERDGRYKPNAPEIAGLRRIEKIDFSGNFHIAQKTSKTDMILVKGGDLVISGINVAKGALGIYEGKNDVVATIHYSAYEFDPKKIDIEYLKRFLKSSVFMQLLKDQVKGGIKTEIKAKHLLPLVIRLPSINDQLAIVKKFRRIEREEESLGEQFSIQESALLKLRQQLIQEAVEGYGLNDKETGVSNRPEESAQELLSSIKHEKAELLAAKAIKKHKPTRKIDDGDIPFETPKHWMWVRLGDLLYENPRNGYSPKAVDFETKTKTLKLGATTSGAFDCSQIKYIDEDISKDSHLWLKKGDILVQRSNSIEHVGVSAIYTGEDYGFIYPDLMMKLRFAKQLSIKYLHYVLSSPFSRKYFRSNATGAQKSMPKINQGVVANALIPLPPRTDQDEIVSKLDGQLEICKKLSSEILENKRRSSTLIAALSREIFQKSIPIVAREQTSRVGSQKKLGFYRRTLLAAEIVDQLHKEPTLGHLKLQKLIFLCQKTQEMQLPTNFSQQAAGPYDPQMARSIDKQLRDKKWFDYKKSELHKYQPLDEAGSHKDDFEKYFADDLSAISRIIGLFRRARSEEMEAVATLYACWEELLSSGNEISNDLLTAKFYAWSEQKSRFPSDRLNKTITWMTENGIFPRTSASGELVQ